MQPDKDLKSLDALIARLGGSSEAGQSSGPGDLLLEHLQAARRNLLGARAGEYSLSLEQAKESLAFCIPDKGRRAETNRVLQSLMDPELPKQQPPDVAPRGGSVLPSPVIAH